VVGFLKWLAREVSDWHGYGIPGGYTDTGTAGTGTDSNGHTHGQTRTPTRDSRTRHGGFWLLIRREGAGNIRSKM